MLQMFDRAQPRSAGKVRRVLMAWLAWISIWAIFVLSMSLLFKHVAPEPVIETRFTAIVNGHAVECVRRVDHVNHTQSLAC